MADAHSFNWFAPKRHRGFAGPRVRYAGKSLWMTEDDPRAWRGLGRLAAVRRAENHDSCQDALPVRLVAFRREFREIVRRRLLVGLLASLKDADQYDDPELGRIAIWLLGRCGRSYAAPIVAQLRHHDEVAMRREVARALRRMGALVELEAMSRFDPDERVRRLATSFGPAPFERRLSRYADREVRRVAMVEPGLRREFFALAPLTPGRPAKTAAFIRAILEHIRLLVRGPHAPRS